MDKFDKLATRSQKNVQPPDSYQPYPPPAYGYQQPGQYGAQYPPQYPPQYPYPYYGPPPKPDNTGKIIKIVVVVLVLVIAVPIVLAGVLIVYLQTLPSSGGEVETSLGLRAEQTSNGIWTVSVISGSRNAAGVRLQVIVPNTSNPTVNKMVSSLSPTNADPDATYNDNNGNNKLDAGDTFLLKASGGHIAVGYTVQLLAGSSIIGTVKALPA